MLKKRLYTFIVASHADAKLWRLSIPYPILIGIGFFALIGLVSAVAASYHYGRMLFQMRNYSHVLVENDYFRSENHNYRIQTAQLSEKIDFLDTTARKLMTLTGMNSEGAVGGIGGFSRDGFTHTPPASKGTLKSIDAYNKSISLLEDRYRGLSESISEKLLVEGSWPAFLPVKGYITAGMGSRKDPFNESFSENHEGLDISAPYGSSIYAPADGIVIFAGPREGYGNMVVVDHKFGVATRYGHLSKINVEVGQRVLRSDVIGYVGATGRTTGSHLHYEMWVNNRPVNPQKWLSRR
jgi:murein DD-endopeptidase MepM/ murein hydrolase activator NlpD